LAPYVSIDAHDIGNSIEGVSMMAAGGIINGR
jgi:hypothetical protein